MKAAAVAGERGHRVTLCEGTERLGGQALLAQALPGRGEFGVIVDNLRREMEVSGVEVRLNSHVDRAFVEMLCPDAVIIATGATPYRPDVEIGDDVHAVDVWQLLKGEVNPGASVVIADWRCDWIGLGIAEKLAREGSHVRLCVDGEMAGQNLQRYLRWHWVGQLQKLGVEFVPYARFFGALGNTAYFMHSLSGDAIECGEMDTLVIAQGHQPVTALEEELRSSEIPLFLAGDCRSPRSAEEAVYEGMEAGRGV
jgi:NADPH-dependent 2,4-dienoyl-CoA reductase/sulfur reductase-like enzyme